MLICYSLTWLAGCVFIAHGNLHLFNATKGEEDDLIYFKNSLYIFMSIYTKYCI